MSTKRPIETGGYQVFCTDEGRYILATHEVFLDIRDAETYVEGVARSSRPVIISRHEVIRAAINAKLSCGDPDERK